MTKHKFQDLEQARSKHQQHHKRNEILLYIFQKMIKTSAWMAIERTKENSAVWKPFVKQGGYPIWAIYRFWWSLSFVIKKIWVSSLSNMENMKIKSRNLQNNKFVAMKRKALPPKIHVPNMSHWEGKEKGRCVWTKWPWIGWWCPNFVIAFQD